MSKAIFDVLVALINATLVGDRSTHYEWDAQRNRVGIEQYEHDGSGEGALEFGYDGDLALIDSTERLLAYRDRDFVVFPRPMNGTPTCRIDVAWSVPHGRIAPAWPMRDVGARFIARGGPAPHEQGAWMSQCRRLVGASSANWPCSVNARCRRAIHRARCIRVP